MKKPEMEKYPVCFYRNAPHATLNAIAADLVFPVRAALPREFATMLLVHEAALVDRR